MPNIISSSVKISRFADIEESMKGSILTIKDGCHIDSFVKIKFAGGMGSIEIGENCYINSGTVLYSGNGIKLGNKVLIASNCTLAPVNHGIKRASSMLEQTFMSSKGGIIIQDDVWIGANSVILDGAIIEKGCIIGAGSVVKGLLKSYGIYVGNPLKFIRYRE
jgi:virginiamycin A acetyltransferase